MSINQFTVLLGVLLLAWIALNTAWYFRDKKASKAALTRLEQHPEDLVIAHLEDDDPLMLTVQFRGEQPIRLISAPGLVLVRVFEELRNTAPQAFRRVTRGGRDVPL